uniref:Uncharacterized protein n=2 Tax=Ditylenchus dipsaci TaxID=166011 RepID=A0A915DVJ8_9BILA
MPQNLSGHLMIHLTNYLHSRPPTLPDHQLNLSGPTGPPAHPNLAHYLASYLFKLKTAILKESKMGESEYEDISYQDFMQKAIKMEPRDEISEVSEEVEVSITLQLKNGFVEESNRVPEKLTAIEFAREVAVLFGDMIDRACANFISIYKLNRKFDSYATLKMTEHDCIAEGDRFVIKMFDFPSYEQDDRIFFKVLRSFNGSGRPNHCSSANASFLSRAKRLEAFLLLPSIYCPVIGKGTCVKLGDRNDQSENHFPFPVLPRLLPDMSFDKLLYDCRREDLPFKKMQLVQRVVAIYRHRGDILTRVKDDFEKDLRNQDSENLYDPDFADKFRNTFSFGVLKHCSNGVAEDVRKNLRVISLRNEWASDADGRCLKALQMIGAFLDIPSLDCLHGIMVRIDGADVLQKQRKYSWVSPLIVHCTLPVDQYFILMCNEMIPVRVGVIEALRDYIFCINTWD